MSLRPRAPAFLARWFDSAVSPGDGESRAIDWARILPFAALHVACLAVLWVGVSAIAVATAVALYAVRMFAITAFYHRYFSHKAFSTSRAGQLAFAILGASAAQRGPLWWASHHRHHHAYADRPADAHSPRQHGFWWSHMGWFLSRRNFATRLELVLDLARYPELRFLDRFDVLVPALLAASLYAAGAWLERAAPALGANGPQLLVWGFVVSTVALYHATFLVNSVAHGHGRRRYATRDDSGNSLWLALLTFGEGWHNNHHHFPGAARQGFYWWEVDLTWLGLRLLAALGIVRNLRAVPPSLRAASHVRSQAGTA
jgi:stearoyl-CoA desaturase (delta-9 desaturase)